MAEALFDLLGSAAARAEDEDGPEGAKRKRSRAAKREDQEELTLPAAPAGRKSAADGGGGARKVDRRTDAADAARRGVGSAGAGGSGRADGGLRANGRGIADGAPRSPSLLPFSADADARPACTPHAAALARAGLANASLPQLPFPLFPGLAPGLGYIHPGGGWPQAFGAGAGVDGSMTAQQLLLPPRRFKHCASHVYIAHFIDHQQQQQRFQFFQQQMSASFPPAVAPADAAALAAAAGDGRAAAGRDGADLASRRMPPAPSVAPFGLMSGFDRAGAAAAPALAAAQLQQYAQVRSSCAAPLRRAALTALRPAAAALVRTDAQRRVSASVPGGCGVVGDAVCAAGRCCEAPLALLCAAVWLSGGHAAIYGAHAAACDARAARLSPAACRGSCTTGRSSRRWPCAAGRCGRRCYYCHRRRHS